MDRTIKLGPGVWVEVRSKEEILKTLDDKGQLEGMPFMPQMFQYCGKRFIVYKRAHKTCDTVFPVRGRRMANAVHLNTRCDGEAYGGCQAGCLIFWKVAWLRQIGNPESGFLLSEEEKVDRIAIVDSSIGSEAVVWKGTRAITQQHECDDDDPSYVCQATQLPFATTNLAWWDIRQYVEDYSSGNERLLRILRGGLYSLYSSILNAGIGLGPVMRQFYDMVQKVLGGTQYPRKQGAIPAGKLTPHRSLNLRPGELVRVKSHQQILATLDTNNRNRGLFFDAEAVPFCGGTYRVQSRVNKILDEKTGKMMNMKNECIILEGVFCQSRYSECRMFCPRAIYSYWREIWLERVIESEIDTRSRP